jgi:hypothetical protein
MQHILNTLLKLEEEREKTKRNLDQHQELVKHWFDKISVNSKDFQVGDLVLKWDKLLIFVASEVFSLEAKVPGMWEFLLAPILTFIFSEIGLEMRLGPHGKVDGICGFVWGCHTHKEDKIF